MSYHSISDSVSNNVIRLVVLLHVSVAVCQHAAAVVDEADFHLFVNLWQNLVTIAENAHKISKDKRLRYEVKAGE